MWIILISGSQMVMMREDTGKFLSSSDVHLAPASVSPHVLFLRLGCFFLPYAPACVLLAPGWS
jgi:hypothetical protein